MGCVWQRQTPLSITINDANLNPIYLHIGLLSIEFPMDALIDNICDYSFLVSMLVL